MKQIDILHEDEWISLRKIRWPEKSIYGYTYSHETRCNGQIISILPFKIEASGMMILLRSEVTPCWDTEKPIISSITGGVEKDHVGPNVTASHELWEEAGYKASPEEFISLGTCRGTKSCDTIYHLFSIDLTDIPRKGEGSGDGSELETLAHCFWAKPTKIIKIEDPIAHVCFTRLNDLLA